MSDARVSPGLSWYEDAAGARTRHAPLEGDARADVVIIGGGYTGLSAARHLAAGGADTILIEAHRLGDGASGRNGGQLGTGMRQWVEELEPELGIERTRLLFALAETAKAELLSFVRDHGVPHGQGQISVAHRARFLDAYRRHVDIMAERYGYAHLSFLDREATERHLGSRFYHGGIRDTGTAHVDPLRLVMALGAAASAAGARLHEQTPALSIEPAGSGVIVRTPRATIRAGHCLVAVNAYGCALEPVSAAHIMPIGSFIGATEPLGPDSPVLPGGEAVDDSRFVVRYFRRFGGGRLLFGGREVYGSKTGANVESHIRRQIREIYPALADIPISHCWGGYVGITIPRMPFVREVMPRVISAGGYSGHGVMLAVHVGRLFADTLLGRKDALAPLKELRIPPFPGGRRLRAPLLFLALSWYALRDRL